MIALVVSVKGVEGAVEGMAVSRWEVGRMSDDSLAMILKIIRLAAFAFGRIRARPKCTMTPSALGMRGPSWSRFHATMFRLPQSDDQGCGQCVERNGEER